MKKEKEWLKENIEKNKQVIDALGKKNEVITIPRLYHLVNQMDDDAEPTVYNIAGILNDYHLTGVLSEECAIELIGKELHTYYGTKPPEFIIPIPKLKTSDGKQQYLTFDYEFETYFASRLNGKLKQTFTVKELSEVPEMYRANAQIID